jgi:hypothetical protein
MRRTLAMDGSPFRSRARHVLASNGRLHGQMLQVIQEFEAARSRT